MINLQNYADKIQSINKVEIEDSKDGYKIIRVEKDHKSKYLGSIYNAKKNVDNIVREFENIEDYTTVYIIGLGTGEYIKSLGKFINNTINVIIIEPEIGIIKKFLETTYKDIKKVDNIKVYPYIQNYNEELQRCIIQYSHTKVKIIQHEGYFFTYKEEVKDIVNIIKETIVDNIIIKNTRITFSKQWFEATVSNLKHINQCIYVNKYKDIYKDKPAVIVSAGPSLDKNIKDLRGISKNFIIISGGRTLRPLLENGIIPDYLCIIDNSQESLDLLEGLVQNVNIPLICSELVPTEMFEQYKGTKILHTNSELIRTYANERIPNMSVGGSVAHAATMFALYSGCNPIIFIGQDLAYTDDKVHADNSKFIQEKYESLEKFDNVIDDNDIYINDIYGNKVRTSLSLNNFKKTFEEIITIYKDNTFINCTEGGADIKGTIVKTLKKTLNEYEITNKDVYDDSIDDIKNVLNDGNIKNVILLLEKSGEFLKKIIIKMDEAILLNENMNILMKKGNTNINEILKKLEKIDKMILERREDIIFVDYILQDTIYNVIYCPEYIINDKDTEKERLNKIYSKGKELYSGIKIQSEYALKVIKNELQVLKNNLSKKERI